MKLTKKMMLASVLATMLLFASCSSGNTTNEVSSTINNEVSSEQQQEEQELIEYTVDTLAGHNGKDGARAYVAVNGLVYDITDSPAWQDGGHQGQVAGVDITAMMESDSPHGVGKVDEWPIVGKYVQ